MAHAVGWMTKRIVHYATCIVRRASCIAYHDASRIMHLMHRVSCKVHALCLGREGGESCSVHDGGRSEGVKACARV